MLIECPNKDCSVQFSVNAQACPSCGTENLRVGEEVKDTELEQANSRHRLVVCVIAGGLVFGYLLSLGGYLADGNWIAVPGAAVLMFVFWKIFMTAAEDKPPERID